MSTDSKNTENIGAKLGSKLRGGEVIELVSDFGGGKTTLVRGLARGAGSDDVVASPSFTISRIYDTPKFTINHFDFYRLGQAGLIQHELADVLGDPSQVIVAEWAQVIRNVLPKDRLKINISKTAENTRELTLICPNKLKYLTEGLC